jgi:hypothetical protein
MKRHLTEHLSELAPQPLGEAIAAGEGFEVILAGAAVRWQQTAAPKAQAGAVVWELEQIGGSLKAAAALQVDPAHRAGRYNVELINAGTAPVTLGAIYPLVVRFGRAHGPWRTLRARGGSSENFYPPRAAARAIGTCRCCWPRPGSPTTHPASSPAWSIPANGS